ncbi:MAG: hypothetical protein KAS72_10240 [Phycisphaerales bacterium]|nr:hypothetical protein [Phycisphaerales bacterium]
MDVRFVKVDTGYVELLPAGVEVGRGVRLRVPEQVMTVDGVLCDPSGADAIHRLTGVWRREVLEVGAVGAVGVVGVVGRTMIGRRAAVVVSLRGDEMPIPRCEVGLAIENTGDEPLGGVAVVVGLELPAGPRQVDVERGAVTCCDLAGRRWELRFDVEGAIAEQRSDGVVAVIVPIADTIVPGASASAHGEVTCIR